jgi:hypothetical protein
MTLMSAMARQKKLMTITLTPELADRFEMWRAGFRFPPARTSVIELALSEFLDRQEVSTDERSLKRRGKEKG